MLWKPKLPTFLPQAPPGPVFVHQRPQRLDLAPRNLTQLRWNFREFKTTGRLSGAEPGGLLQWPRLWPVLVALEERLGHPLLSLQGT